MAQKLTVGFKDVNGLAAKTSFWCNDVPTAILAVAALANLSNAQVVSASMRENVDLVAENLTGIAGFANIETVRQKVLLRMSGADPGSVAAKRSIAIVSIPAPLGALVNGAEGNPADPLLTPFIGKVVTKSSVVTDRIDKVVYEK